MKKFFMPLNVEIVTKFMYYNQKLVIAKVIKNSSHFVIHDRAEEPDESSPHSHALTSLWTM
jgi:hypothetical protein